MSLVVFAEPERPPARELPWGSIASLGAHALLIALIPLLATSRPIAPPPPPQAVEVELISAAELEPAIAAAATPVLAAPQAAAEPAEAESVPQNGPIEAARFLAGMILAEDRKIAAALSTLGNDERVIQLCNTEALEQIGVARPQFAPDTLVAYAFGDMSIAAGVLIAPGGAFRSRRRWWNITLRCAVAPDYSAVTAFEFTLGDEVPETEWDAHFLTAEEAEE